MTGPDPKAESGPWASLDDAWSDLDEEDWEFFLPTPLTRRIPMRYPRGRERPVHDGARRVCRKSWRLLRFAG